MSFVSIDDIKEGSSHVTTGDQVGFTDKEGRVRIGTVRIKSVHCGKKSCTKCPHAKYFYAQYRDGEKVRDKYIGVAR